MVVDQDNYLLLIVHLVYRVLLMKSKFFFFVRIETMNISSEVLRDCSLDTIEVQKDDIIILSSDGLWDVIKGNQLQEIMERNTTEVNEFYLEILIDHSLFFFSIYKI